MNDLDLSRIMGGIEGNSKKVFILMLFCFVKRTRRHRLPLPPMFPAFPKTTEFWIIWTPWIRLVTKRAIISFKGLIGHTPRTLRTISSTSLPELLHAIFPHIFLYAFFMYSDHQRPELLSSSALFDAS